MITRSICAGCALLILAGWPDAAPRAAGGEPPAAPAASDRFREAVERARTKVVILRARRDRGEQAATGFIARPGLVLTVAHAVPEARSIRVWVNGVQYPAEVRAVRPEQDLAVLALRAPALRIKPVALASSAGSLAADEPLAIVTGPAQPDPRTSDPSSRVPIAATFRQRVALRNASGVTAPALSMSATVRRGDSGSPVLRVEDGTVVGILSGRELPDAEGTSRTAYAIPIDAVHTWLDGISNGPYQSPAGDAQYYLFDLPGRPAPPDGNR